jgi:hypothetical protein
MDGHSITSLLSFSTLPAAAAMEIQNLKVLKVKKKLKKKVPKVGAPNYI